MITAKIEKMRPIKFRGRDVITGNWAYGYYYPSNGHSIIRDDKNAECIVMPETVGQLSGLLDKNGKEIYEGDLVNVSVGSGFQKITIIGKVEYETQACAFWIKWRDGKASRYHEMKADSGGDYFQSNYYEVIGNVFQNPELLK